MVVCLYDMQKAAVRFCYCPLTSRGPAATASALHADIIAGSSPAGKIDYTV